MSDNLGISEHHIRAAVEVARIIDATGNATEDARSAYKHNLSQGEHRGESLRAGEALLLRLGLLNEVDGRLHPTDALRVLARLDPVGAVEAVRRQTALRGNQGLRALVGAAGEQVVIQNCVEDLAALGREDLSRQVQQVSLVDDSLGYDVHAPVIGDSRARMLEVKTSAGVLEGVFEFFISRNEYDVGRRSPDDWSLVACTWTSSAQVATLLGWCRAASLTAYLPSDGAGRWTEARVRVPKAVFSTGIPPAV
jgi:hypothetical protein